MEKAMLKKRRTGGASKHEGERTVKPAPAGAWSRYYIFII